MELEKILESYANASSEQERKNALASMQEEYGLHVGQCLDGMLLSDLPHGATVYYPDGNPPGTWTWVAHPDGLGTWKNEQGETGYPILMARPLSKSGLSIASLP